MLVTRPYIGYMSAPVQQHSTSRWSRVVHSLRASDEEVEAEQLLQATQTQGCTPINDCAEGAIVTVSGPLRSVVMDPANGVPAVEATLYDGSGEVTVKWMGRRRIAGIEPGRKVSVTGRLTVIDDLPVIFNPRYRLFPLG